jgi:hypothetical protein
MDVNKSYSKKSLSKMKDNNIGIKLRSLVVLFLTIILLTVVFSDKLGNLTVV